MTDFLERIGKLSPKRLALLALELNEQVEALGKRAREPVAVVGMACRFPGGADDLVRYWALLREGRDAIRQVPSERWDIESFYDPDPDVPSGISARNGGFLDRIDGFDAAFFGISPREAITMDPQQRLLLEVSWEALEHAGISPERLGGSASGVYVGICNGDHFQRVIHRGSDSIDAYLASGNAHSVAAGRIAYFLGLQGPALAIDTACSSSLVALHIACQSLRNGETRMALACGVNVMCSPETTIALTKAHMLAPDGRCKTFDAAADGFSRGEGCGVLVLKRLSDAIDDGDRVLAVIRGTATNQDGRSGGLTVPNGPAQELVIRAALANAGLQPADIDYVEAHGTGTSLGDPIEVRALAGALGQGRPDGSPLLIGSVKTNIGHLESAAGVAGVIKVILSLEHERIPAHLHFKQPSPKIAWADYPVAVAAQGVEWPRGARPRLAGVSSFGFSGTNAHVIIEEGPPRAAALPAAAIRPWNCLPLSARSEDALRGVAASYARQIEAGAGVTIADAGHTAGVGRSHFAERLAIVASDETEARDALAAFADGEPHPAIHRGTAVPGQPPEVVFLYTGQGSQYPGMSRLLYDTSPVYRGIIDECDALLGADGAGRTLKSVLHPASAENAAIHETAWTQPALFAVEYALTQLWRSWGVEPAAVIGHSVGEYVAACVAGVFSLEEGLRLIAERGRLMQALPAGGTMAAVFAPAEEVAAAVAPMADRMAIAAINAPDSVVVSGEAAAVDALLAEFARRNVQGHKLFVSLAAHSPLVEPALDAMEVCARTVQMKSPRIPVAWNLTGGALASGSAPDATYWRRHLREPVRFADGMASLYRDGYRVFLEVGPHPTLIALAQRSLPDEGTLLLSSLRRGKDDWNEMTGSLAELYVHGAAIDWAGVDRPYGCRRVSLPTYPFERRSFWISTSAPTMRRLPGAAAGAGRLLGSRLPTAVTVFESLLAPDSIQYLAEHRICGAVFVAGPVFLELAQAAAREAFGPGLRDIREFEIREPLVLPDEGRALQTQLGESPDGAMLFRIHSRPVDGKGDWRLHATGRLVAASHAPTASASGAASLADIAQSLGAQRTCTDYYERLIGQGIELGPAFRSLCEGHWRDGEALVASALPASCSGDAVSWVHPSLMDGAMQAVGLAVPVNAGSDDVYLLTTVDAVELSGTLPTRFWSHARLRNESSPAPAQWVADVTLRSDAGAVLGLIRGVHLRRAPRESLLRAAGGSPDRGLFYSVAWEPAPAALRAAPSLQPTAHFMPRVRDGFASRAVEQGLAVYEDLLPELDRLSAEHAISALHQLGFDDTIGRVFSGGAEAGRLGVAARHARLFGRLLDMLREDGLLRRQGSDFAVAARFGTPDPSARYGELLARFGDVDGELLTLRRCGGKLAGVLRGEQDPLQLLFPDGSFAEARQLYVDSPYAKTYNGALAEALQEAIAAVPPGSRLRILEIGAGTGGTTSFVLPLLPADRTEYTFTDLSPLFLERATERFAAYPFLRRALLDIERDPLGQGFDAGHYDIVIAANVLHATADLRQALSHTRSLLAPGGLLLLLEGVAPERWVDLTFGLTEGWWRFTDTVLRPAYPLIARQAWLELLADLDFTGNAAVPGDASRSRGGAQQALIVAQVPKSVRRWTLLSDRAGVGDALAARLQRRGDQVVSFAAGEPFCGELAGEVVYLGALDLVDRDPLDASAVRDAEAHACELPIQYLKQVVDTAPAGALRRAWLVTRGAQAAAGPVLASAELQAPIWGVGRVFALESPGLWGGLIDLPPEGDVEALADTLIGALDAGDAEDQTAWRAGKRYAPRLVAARPPREHAAAFRADATYLVTGGFGGLGPLVARWLVERGARCIALLGRHVQPDSEAVRAIEALGARVIALGADVADEAAMAALLARLDAEAPPLRGIVHAAADLGAGRIETLTPAQVSGMLRPKIAGAAVLERMTRARELDFLVFFSSTTALLGASGFAHYAAANGFLDALASRVNRPGRRVLSINWGTWEAMRLASSEDQRSFRESGLEPMPAGEALEAMGRLIAGDLAQSVVARIDWDVLKPLHEARRPRPLLSGLGTEAAALNRKATAAATPASGLAVRLAEVPADMRGEVLAAFVREQVAAVLGLDDSQPIAPDTGLFELGMDSLMSVELKRRLERGAGRKLPSTLTFNYPNVGALAAFLAAELFAGEEPSSSGAPDATAADSATVVADAGEMSVDDLDKLSDEELEARLLARLEQTS